MIARLVATDGDYTFRELARRILPLCVVWRRRRQRAVVAQMEHPAQLTNIRGPGKTSVLLSWPVREPDMPLAANVREIIGAVTGLGRLLTTRRVILKKRTSKASWDGWLMTRQAPVSGACLARLRILGAICRTL